MVVGYWCVYVGGQLRSIINFYCCGKFGFGRYFMIVQIYFDLGVLKEKPSMMRSAVNMVSINKKVKFIP